MVKNFLKLINSEIGSVHQAAYLLGFFAICSQVLALFRDRILASEFGTGNILDLYYSAFRIPDIIFVSIASIVSISVLIPYLTERMEKNKESAKEFIDSVFTFFFLFMIVVGGIAYFASPFILSKLFPNFATGSNFAELVSLTRILLLSPVFLGLSNLLASITQVSRRFFIYAISPVVYNIGIIIGIIFLYPTFGLNGLGFGVILGAFLHFAIQAPFIIGQGMFPKIKFPISFGVIKNIILVSLPRTFIASSNEISKLFLISFASFFVPGSIAVFNFSLNLQSVPFSIIGVSYSLAVFPTLSKLFTNGDIEKFLDQMISSARHIIFWSMPLTVLFIVLRAQIVRTVLGSGEFGWESTRLTAAALALFIISLLAQNMSALFVRSYYSRGKTIRPLVMTIFSAIITIVGTFYLIKLFENSDTFRHFLQAMLKVSDIPGSIVLMLPLGFSLGIIFNMILNWIDFSLDFKKFSLPVLKTFFQSFSASIITGFVAYKFLAVFDDVFNINTLLGIFMQGFLSGIIGIISGICILYLLKSRELFEVWDTLHRKIWRTKIPSAPDAELN